MEVSVRKKRPSFSTLAHSAQAVPRVRCEGSGSDTRFTLVDRAMQSDVNHADLCVSPGRSPGSSFAFAVRMAQVHSSSSNSELALGGDDVLTFFRDMDQSWLIDPMTDRTLALAPNAPARSIIMKKPRRSPRVDLLNLRQEATELQLQVQILQEKHAFRESLKANRSDSGLDWCHFALNERSLAKMASQKNERLRKQVEAKMRLLQRIVRCIQRQQLEIKPRSLHIHFRIESHDDTAHVYRVLQSCLNKRSNDRLNAIASQCHALSIKSEFQLRMIRWETFALGDLGVGVEFQESAVIPFASSFVHDVLYRNPVINAVQVQKNAYVDKLTRQPIPERVFPRQMTSYVSAPSDRQLTLRQLRKVGKDTFLLWEDSSCRHRDEFAPPVLVRGSGWAMIAPVPGHEHDLSVIHSGSFIQIHATDGSSLQPTDVLVRQIVANMQSRQRSRLAVTEDILMNAIKQQEEHRPS